MAGSEGRAETSGATLAGGDTLDVALGLIKVRSVQDTRGDARLRGFAKISLTCARVTALTDASLEATLDRPLATGIDTGWLSTGVVAGDVGVEVEEDALLSASSPPRVETHGAAG
ncbi:hypothetical protein PC113_g22148 [Phytophthora cactorum]|uniref:Uncharacterized protein n=1 Tax=Phytophthora cactorum TaxID=29920 RepID=A0A8T0Y6D8_9STRA|nr:hypothetical protein PC113_g22148 [Phytophthora cactorum]KAG3043381.1 hypothetical protein PC121_g22585 [Phytophthora cactorum]